MKIALSFQLLFSVLSDVRASLELEINQRSRTVSEFIQGEAIGKTRKGSELQ